MSSVVSHQNTHHLLTWQFLLSLLTLSVVTCLQPCRSSTDSFWQFSARTVIARPVIILQEDSLSFVRFGQFLANWQILSSVSWPQPVKITVVNCVLFLVLTLDNCEQFVIFSDVNIGQSSALTSLTLWQLWRASLLSLVQPDSRAATQLSVNLLAQHSLTVDSWGQCSGRVARLAVVRLSQFSRFRLTRLGLFVRRLRREVSVRQPPSVLTLTW